MTKTHKIITAVAAFALSGSLAFASVENGDAANGDFHGRRGHHGHRGFMSASFAAKLNLTDAQKAQLKSDRQAFRDANKDFFAQVKATRQELRAARQANDTAKLDSLKATAQSQRAHMKELHQQQHEQFLSVLTPDQKAQLEQMKAEWKAKRGQ
jgi:Spy/CpxP family protein refolding chaperone